MCGICGIIHKDPSKPVEKPLLESMNRVLYHRGPDNKGLYVKKNAGLAHRRLSIIDLETGDQPLSNEDKTVWIVYNGEIYNFRELRKQLKALGHIFHTKSDTEVVVHA